MNHFSQLLYRLMNDTEPKILLNVKVPTMEHHKNFILYASIRTINNLTNGKYDVISYYGSDRMDGLCIGQYIAIKMKIRKCYYYFSTNEENSKYSISVAENLGSARKTPVWFNWLYSHPTQCNPEGEGSMYPETARFHIEPTPKRRAKMSTESHLNH